MTEHSLLFHPPGVIRVITPAEEAAMQLAPRAEPRAIRSQVKPGARPSPIASLTGALRRLAHQWVHAQATRGEI